MSGVVLVVWLPAARLGQTAADHVGGGQDRRVQPGLLCAVAAGVGLVDEGGGDEDSGQDGDEREELRRLERRLGLGAEAADRVLPDGRVIAAGLTVRAGIGGDAHGRLLRKDEAIAATPK